jgi:hypothetical protein
MGTPSHGGGRAQGSRRHFDLIPPADSHQAILA